MNTLALSFVSIVLIGVGATLTFDLWGLFIKQTFRVPPSSICLVGRWIRYMPDGVFRHANIGATARKRAECQVGWMAHYLIGIIFAGVFAAIVGDPWLQSPMPIPAIIFGVITVLAPFFIIQPLFGFGVAASRTANPMQARARSVMNHVAFGVGLYIFGWLVNWSLW